MTNLHQRRWRTALAFVSLLALAVVGSRSAQAQTFTTLHNFTDGADGGKSTTAVIQDKSGKLYGTTDNGGSGYGVVFEVNTVGAETVLYTFTGGADGSVPVAAVLRDSKGNLYGTTFWGGAYCYCGVMFKLDTAGNETVLHSFGNSSDGAYPAQGLVMDKAGSLYGTTNGTGSGDYYGTIFKLDSAGNETILHNFAGGASDGAYPDGGHLTMDKAGNLYGLASAGGMTGKGVLYELSKKGTFTILHSFAGGKSDGCTPLGTAAIDKAGNFYGTTRACGSHNYGTVWRVSRGGKETILHNFAGYPSDGFYPYGGAARDSKGNLYGVTQQGGAHHYGAVYELSAKGKLTVLHSFSGSGGAGPLGESFRGAEGTLFGTTVGGGTYGYGTVWKYVP
jgi:uncharacterized repeat protein (TIGR03803 family)